jgi:hypothetical protein
MASSAGVASNTKSTDPPEATVVRLSYKDPNINQRFNVKNMFPGDEEVKYYCARVQFIDKATLYFDVNVHSGYKKLAEVLEISVYQINDNKLLYEGLIGDVPEIKAIELSGKGKTTTDVFYKITVSLDTSVGNEYMQKELLADFHWWFEGKSGGGGGDDDGGGSGGGGGVPDKPDFPGPIIGPAETDDEDETTKEIEGSEDTVGEESESVIESDPDTSESDTVEDDTGTDSSDETESDSDDISKESSSDVVDSSDDDTTSVDYDDDSIDTTGKEDGSQETGKDESDDYEPGEPPASQTGDENIVRIKIAAFSALSALWLLLLLLLVRLKENEDEQKEN